MTTSTPTVSLIHSFNFTWAFLTEISQLLVKSSQVYFTTRTFQEYASRKQRKEHAIIKADCTL